MNTSATPAPALANRRPTLALQWVIVAFSLTACCTLAAVLGSKFAARLDITSTRDHQLSSQTQATLAKLESSGRTVTIAIAADFGAIPRLTLQRLRDVLDGLSRASPNIGIKIIDTSSSQGLSSFDSLLKKLAEEDRPQIDAQLVVIRTATGATAQLSAKAQAFATTLEKVRDELLSDPLAANNPNSQRARDAWNALAAQMRTSCTDLQAAQQKATDASARSIEPLNIPPLDEASSGLRLVIDSAASNWQKTSESLDVAARAPGLPNNARVTIRAAIGELAQLRDAAAATLQQLSSISRLRIFQVAAAISRNQGALLIAGPTLPGSKTQANATVSVTAVDLTQLLTLGQDSAASGGPVDFRYRAEELLTAGLAAFTDTPKPLLVITHGDKGKLAPDFAPIRRLADRLALRSINLAEWRVGQDETPPPAIAQAKADGRPIVYLVVAPEVRSAGRALGMNKVAGTLKTLLNAGEPVMVCLNPSTLPTAGASDPMVEPLAELGLTVESGLVLAEQFTTPTGPQAATDIYITPSQGPTETAASGSPLAGSLSGLKLRILWPLPMTVAQPSALPHGTKLWPVLQIPPSATIWAESEWLQLRAARGDVRAAPPITPGGPKDRASGSSPWTVAVAIERDNPVTRPVLTTAVQNSGPNALTQRALVIGSNGWFVDAVTDVVTVIDGRPVFDAPGNGELFVSGLLWLTHQDDQLGRSAQAQAAALIPPLSEGTLSALRWAIAGMLPLLVLFVGATIRLIRR